MSLAFFSLHAGFVGIQVTAKRTSTTIVFAFAVHFLFCLTKILVTYWRMTVTLSFLNLSQLGFLLNHGFSGHDCNLDKIGFFFSAK